jgi:hypothetical protein
MRFIYRELWGLVLRVFEELSWWIGERQRGLMVMGKPQIG